MSMQRCCLPARVDRTDRSSDAALFKALGDPHEVCVCDFTGALPLEQPTVSHHLRLLREAGLVTCERRGTWVYYRLAADARARIDAALSSLIPEKALA